MPDCPGPENSAFYRVRIKEGHKSAGLLVSTTGKRCIPSTQFWLTVIYLMPIGFHTMPHCESKSGLETWGL